MCQSIRNANIFPSKLAPSNPAQISRSLSLPHKFLQILRTPRSEPSPSDCSTVDDDADVSHLSHLAAIGADRRTVWEGMAAAALA